MLVATTTSLPHLPPIEIAHFPCTRQTFVNIFAQKINCPLVFLFYRLAYFDSAVALGDLLVPYTTQTRAADPPNPILQQIVPTSNTF